MKSRLSQLFVCLFLTAALAAGGFVFYQMADEQLNPLTMICLLVAAIAAIGTVIHLVAFIFELFILGLMASPGLIGWCVGRGFGGCVKATSFVTHYGTTATKAAVKTTGRGLAITSAGDSPVFRYYAYKKAFAILVGVCVIAIALGIRWTIPSLSVFVWGVPVLLGVAVTFIPDASERIQAWPLVIRQWVTGGRQRQDFESSYGLSRHAGKLTEERHPTGGILTGKRYLGDSLYENTGFPKHIFSHDSGCEINYGCVGSGKHIAEVKILGSIGKNSFQFISTKAEQINEILGRRVDPRWFDGRAERLGKDPGINPRGITNVKYHVPGGRAFTCDPGQLSKYPDSGYPFLHEIDLDNPKEATGIISMLALALKPDNPKANDPFWSTAARLGIEAGIGWICVTLPPEKRTLTAVAELFMGIDPAASRRVADPKNLEKALIQMMQCDALGGFIQSSAAQLAGMGERQRGSVIAEICNALRWTMSPMYREHLAKPGTWSYREVGSNAEQPVSVFVLPDRMDKMAGDTFMRLHIAMSTTLMLKHVAPADAPTTIIADECPQYLAGSGLVEKALILRAANIKVCLFAQNYPAIVNAVGEIAAETFASSSTECFFGINDTKTAGRLVELLGMRCDESGKTWSLASVQDLMHELSPISPIKMVKPYAGGRIMRLNRRGYKTIRTPTGLHLEGLPGLEGHYDD